MSADEMNKYRFSSGEEPSDEMLEQLMREAADNARERGKEAHDRFFEHLRREVDEAKARRSFAS